jgi:Uma2 family endonuclease
MKRFDSRNSIDIPTASFRFQSSARESIMNEGGRLTLEEFEERLRDGDRWIELTEGRLVRHESPDDRHGDVVRNLSRALAAFLRTSTDTYACFELPLIISAAEPSVVCPAISCFRFEAGNRFAETDKVLTDARPVLAVEVASSNDRRKNISKRVSNYLEWGVAAVWVIDPIEHLVHQFHGASNAISVREPKVLHGYPVLPGFSIPVSDLFKRPEWMKDRDDQH